MSIKIPSINTSIFTSPKVMCTSVKWTALDLTGQAESLSSQPDFDIHSLYPLREFNAQEMSSVANYAIVRDPVSRFASLYKDKILKGKIRLNPNSSLASSGLSLLPDFDEFLELIDEYQRYSGLISSHAKPQVNFLGIDPKFYDSVFSSKNTDILEQILSEKAQRPVLFAQRNVSGSELRPKVGFRARRKIRELYKIDYEVFGDYFGGSWVNR